MNEPKIQHFICLFTIFFTYLVIYMFLHINSFTYLVYFDLFILYLILFINILNI